MKSKVCFDGQYHDVVLSIQLCQYREWLTLLIFPGTHCKSTSNVFTYSTIHIYIGMLCAKSDLHRKDEKIVIEVATMQVKT